MCGCKGSKAKEERENKAKKEEDENKKKEDEERKRQEEDARQPIMIVLKLLEGYQQIYVEEQKVKGKDGGDEGVLGDIKRKISNLIAKFCPPKIELKYQPTGNFEKMNKYAFFW